MKIADLLESTKLKTWAKCSWCGKNTTWWFRSEEKPLCKKCKTKRIVVGQDLKTIK